ncbi:MAG: bifunctional phosphoglucose/phosphomannose isomerase [Pyrodictiaceae archaeon]
MDTKSKELLKSYLEWPSYAKRHLEKALELKVEGDYDFIVICGMGGSGIVGDYVKAISETYGQKPVYVVKSFKLPSWVDANSLVITVSYSGNTLETLHCFKDAVRRGTGLIAVTSGGKLAEEAKKKKISIVEVEKGVAARAVFPSLLYSVLTLLSENKMLGLTIDELQRSIELMNTVVEDWEPRVLKLVDRIYGKIPILLSCCEYYPLALRLKNEFNENAKVQCKAESLPEWGHNDIEGWGHALAAKEHVIIAIDPGNGIASRIINKAIKILSEITSIAVVPFSLEGRTLLDKLMYGTLVGGLTSILYGERRGVNILETKFIEAYRKELEDILRPEGG